MRTHSVNKQIPVFVFLPSQKWQEKSQEAKKKYEEDMKAYKAKKANEPDHESPEESKPKKKGLVKESSDKRKDNEKKKTSSPRKSGDSQKFKSAEFVDTDDSSSEDEGGVSCVAFSFLTDFEIYSNTSVLAELFKDRHFCEPRSFFNSTKDLFPRRPLMS